jgi:hypothetical protein
VSGRWSADEAGAVRDGAGQVLTVLPRPAEALALVAAHNAVLEQLVVPHRACSRAGRCVQLPPPVSTAVPAVAPWQAFDHNGPGANGGNGIPVR